MKNKKLAALLLAAAMLLTLSACSETKEAADPASTEAPAPAETPAETTTPAPTPVPEPEWDAAVSRATYLGGLLKYLQLGDRVTILGEWEDYFVIEGEDVPLLINKWFLRPEAEAIPEAWDGYAKDQTRMYDTAYLLGEAVSTLALNTELSVLDTRGNWALVQLKDGTTGYVNADDISPWFITYGGGGGGGNGGIGGGDFNGGGSTGGGAQDGTDVNLGDISFTHFDRPGKVVMLSTLSQSVYETYTEPVPGVILSNETEAYAYMYFRDAELKVTGILDAEESWNVLCQVWMDGITVTVPRWLVRMEGDTPYESWTAYGRDGGVVYSEIQKWHEIMPVTNNQEFEVVDELTEIGLYVVRIENGYGYVQMDYLSATEYVAPVYTWNGGGGGSGGDFGGGSGSVPDWTPPKL